jgi:hypothetical protein
MGRQEGRVQLEPSDLRLALNMAKMANGGYLRATIVETYELIKKPRAEVREEEKRRVEFPGPPKVKAAMERQPAMVCKDHTAGCLPCQNGTAKNPHTRWRWKGPVVFPSELAVPQPRMPSPPGMPPGPPGDAEGNESHELEGMPSSWVYMHSPLPNTQFFNHNAFAKDSTRGKDFIPDLRSTPSAGWKYR